MLHMSKCCICHKEIEDKYGNNPFPYMTEGRCCNDCNLKYVIPARGAQIHKDIHKGIRNEFKIEK